MTQRYCEKCGGKDFVDSTAGHFCHPVYVQPIEEKKEGQLGEKCCVCFGEEAFDDGIVHCDCKCHQPSEEKKYIFQKSPSSASSIHIEPRFDELEELDDIDRAVIFHEDPVSEEKKDWEEKIRQDYAGIVFEAQIDATIRYWRDFIENIRKEEREALLKEILAEVDEKKTTEEGDYIEKQQYHFYNLALSEVTEIIRNKII